MLKLFNFCLALSTERAGLKLKLKKEEQKNDHA